MKKIGIEDLIKSVPHTIRMELLKQQLTDIYMREKIILKNFDTRFKDFYNVGSWSQDEFLAEEAYKYNSIFNCIDTFLRTIEKAELTDNMMLELYQWAKNKRREMNLRDNLFNLFEGYIEGYRDYEPLNEELNGRKVL